MYVLHNVMNTNNKYKLKLKSTGSMAMVNMVE